MNSENKKSDKPKKPSDKLKQPPKRESRIHVTEKPFTLHIDDTAENVARALFGKPLKRE
ncbi:MAG: hypothetical protein OXI77_05230 [Chloroflexota bacterium]|nr:hypothetical protein [Chloroflexota bacterium]MDE2909932.1 hypothetical protein [Chloroflexota bacterium]